MEEDLDADIEIDPDLFIKCRLCIEENGSFPIHQPLQDQIKFCFDITVQDLDYLSKLLCKKCRTILGEFVTIKKKFIANQTLLLDKLQSKEKQRELNHTKAECSIEEVNKEEAECSIEKQIKENPEKTGIYQIREAQESKTRKNAKKRVKGRYSLFNSWSEDEENSQSVRASYSRYSTKRRKRKISHSTESSYDKESAVLEKETIKIDEPKQSFTWDQSYQKFYVCRFCDYHNHTEEGIIIHGKIHSKFMESYREPLKKHCIIQMEKMDERPNVTGNPGNVVLSHDKILSDVHNTCYFVKYILPQQCYESKHKRSLYDFSKDDAIKKYRNRKNKNIILKSRSSSNKTVVLEGSKIETSDENSNTKVTLTKTSESPIPCIDILDTSSNDSTVQLKDNHLSKDNNLRIIYNVATDCFKTYLASCAKVKKQKQQKKHLNKKFDEILHRKLLSVGKKLMPTNVPRGFPTPGLLKYLQYKNVPINWIPMYRNEQNHTFFIETAPQKINTDLKGWSAIKGNVDFENRDKIPHDNIYDQLSEKKNDSGKIIENNEKETHSYEQEISNDVETSTTGMNTTSEISFTSVVPVAKNIMGPAVSHQIIVENNEKEMHIYEQEINNDVETNKASMNTTSENSSTSVVPLAKTFMGSAVSHLVMDADIEQGNKLLNANPVANPKQLPKKSTFMPFCEVKKLVDSNNSPKPIEHVKDTILKKLLVSEGSVLVRHNLLELPMPIITSTTSLAETNKTKSMKQSCIEVSNKPEAESDQRNETANNIPRIKCKPVSELMPQSPRPVQEVASVNLMPHLQTIISKMTPITAQQILFTQTDMQKITVNSVHLPNSSSISPIEYFKILLKMHGLELISQVNYELTQDYISLVKFKAEFSSRVIMWLSLFAYKSTFCLKLRNSAEEMDLDQLSAHWQMKILQAYRGEVSQKILQFSKTLNERLHNNAKQFVLLLGSIEFKINPG